MRPPVLPQNRVLPQNALTGAGDSPSLPAKAFRPRIVHGPCRVIPVASPNAIAEATAIPDRSRRDAQIP
jgi:hypothetical protein